jgi:signal transduction histidine kinase
VTPHYSREFRFFNLVQRRPAMMHRSICMEIADNGRAFLGSNPVKGTQRQSLGLLGMQERVRLVNGQFAIESVPKRGPTVRVRILLPGSEIQAKPPL